MKALLLSLLFLLPLTALALDEAAVEKDLQAIFNETDVAKAQAELKAAPRMELLPLLFALAEKNVESEKFTVGTATKDGKSAVVTNYYKDFLVKYASSAAPSCFFLGASDIGKAKTLLGDYAGLYFWYEGRNFMPEIFDSWYECWKDAGPYGLTNFKVKERLMKDLGAYGVFAIPCVLKSIAAGDKTLSPALYNLGNHKQMGALKNPSDTEAWEMPACPGLSKVKKIYVKKGLISEEAYENMEKARDIQKEFLKDAGKAKASYWYWTEGKAETAKAEAALQADKAAMEAKKGPAPVLNGVEQTKAIADPASFKVNAKGEIKK